MITVKFAIRDYLKQQNAIGRERAVPVKQVAAALLGADNGGTERAVRRMVEVERGAGALICASTGRPNGYFLPSCDAEVLKQKETMEKGIARRAVVLRPFRKAVQQMAAGKKGRRQ